MHTSPCRQPLSLGPCPVSSQRFDVSRGLSQHRSLDTTRRLSQNTLMALSLVHLSRMWMLLHPLVWSNTAIVSILGPSQLCPLLARCHSTCSASPRPPGSPGRPAAGPAQREASAKYASASAPLTHIARKAGSHCSNITVLALSCFGKIN